MKYVSVPPLVASQVTGNLSDLPVRSNARQPHGVGFCKMSSGAWVDVTNAEFLTDVRAIAKGLMASGVGPGERVAIMSRTRYEWALTDFAIWTAGAVSVPIYETSSALQVNWIVKDAGCAAVILETPAHARVLAEEQAGLPELRHVWQIDAGGLDTLKTAGAEVTDEALDHRRSQASRGDIATLIYTSGTTGPPKGCQLTHDNFMALAENASEQKAISEGKGKIFRAAAATAIAWSEAKENGEPGVLLRGRHTVFEKLVYGKLRAAMGGKVAYAVSGGAPLGPRLCHFYRGIGVTVLEGYGLTETTAPATLNMPGLIKIGTVGTPLPGIAIKIADDSEILIKGSNIFSSYLNNDAATRDALVDGWFHTGDIGELDDEGFLTITGRKKELLITAGGKNVVPAFLENRLRAHPLVSQCIVVGDKRPFIGALITLDPEMLPSWAKNQKLKISMEEALTNVFVRAELERAVANANKAVSKPESIRKFTVLADDFTKDNGYLTPSSKLKRNMVMKDYASEVEELYSGPKESPMETSKTVTPTVRR